MVNKIQHNNSITTGDFGISGGVVTSISGFPVGGTGGTIIGGSYFGDGETIDVNEQTRIISIHSYTKEKINSIPHKVSDLTDSANYQPVSAMSSYYTTAQADEKFVTQTEYGTYKNDVNRRFNNKQDKLTFGYNSNGEISGIGDENTITAIAGGTGGDGNYSAGIDLKIENNIISVDTNGNPNNETEKNRNFVEGSWTVASGYMNHAEGVATSALGYGVHAQGMWTKFSSSKWSDTEHTDPVDIYWADGAGATVEGYCNATTSCPMSGEGNTYGPIHGGIIKVIGNGYRQHRLETESATYYPSDALIIYRDGSISAAGNISANGIELGAGGTTYQGRKGVSVDGGYVELTQTAYEAVTSIPNISNDVETLKTASGDWNKVSDKLDTTAFSDVSGNFLTAHQSLDEYATKDYANNASANALSQAQTWVGQQGYLTEVPNTYALKTDIPTTVAQLTDSGNYYKKTETSGATELSNEFAKYVTSSNVTTQDTDYVMTTTGWKVLTLPGGGMTQVIHDDTLTGQGNANDNKLGVAWSALSGNTIYSAKSAESARYTKQLKDASKTIQISDVTALQHWASSNSSTWDDVTAKLGTAQYATDSATFVTSSNSTIIGTKQYALTTAGWAEVQVGASLTASSGINIDNNLISVTLGRNLKFDTYSNVTTEDNLSATSYRAGEYDNQYTIVNKYGLETYFSSSPNSSKLTLSTIGLNNTLEGGNRSITANYDLNHLFFKSYDNTGTYSGNYSQVEVKVLQETAPEETQHRSSITLTDYYGGVEHTGLITVEKIAQWDQGGGTSFTGVTTAGSISGDGLTNPLGLKTSAEQALTSVSSKVDIPDTTQTVLNNNYLIYSTLTGAGTTTGWMPLSANYYSKTEADGRYVATADVGSGLYYSGSSPKLGVKLGTDLAFNTTTSAIQINTDGTAYGAHAFVEGTNTTASGAGAHAEGADVGAYGQGAHAGGYGTHTTGVGNFIHGTFLSFASPDGTTNSNTPVFVGGTLNYTTAQNYNVHGGYLQIMGNGTYTGSGRGNNSDAYILYRDGTVSAKQFQNADGSETINGTTYTFSGVDNIEILPNAATANTASFPNDNVIRIILEA